MRGSYVYFLNGEQMDIREGWQVRPAPPGRLIRSERSAYGTTLSVDAVETGGRLTRFDVRYRAGATDIRAWYEVDGQEVRVQRLVNGREEYRHVRTEALFIVSPIMRVFTGGVIRQLVALGQPGCVLVPWLFDPAQAERFLLPHFDTRSARLLEKDGAMDVYEYIGEQYDANARFWVDARSILARYNWQQGDKSWDVRLGEK